VPSLLVSGPQGHQNSVGNSAVQALQGAEAPVEDFVSLKKDLCCFL
jgi:hypothetical protein